MTNYDNDIISGLNRMIELWSFEDVEDMSTFAKGIKAGLEIARNYIFENMKGIEDD